MLHSELRVVLLRFGVCLFLFARFAWEVCKFEKLDPIATCSGPLAYASDPAGPAFRLEHS